MTFFKCRLLLFGGLMVAMGCATGTPPVPPPAEPSPPPSAAVPLADVEPALPPAAPEAVAPPPLPGPMPPGRITIAAVGDIMLGGKGQLRLEANGYDFPFAATRHLIASADVAVGNLETALTAFPQKAVPEKKYSFQNPPDKVAAALMAAGFDLVSLANNHSMDYGSPGLADTMAALGRHGVRTHGAGETLDAAREPAVFHLRDDQTAGFLAYSNTFPETFWATETSPGTAFGHERHVRADVASLVAQGVDIIVVSFHWGGERVADPRPYQTLLARAAIDAGADLVIGHHPHILQGVEHYNAGLILYSLGNYAFTTYSNQVQYSAIATVCFQQGQFTSLRLTPININNFQVELQPQIVRASAAEAVFHELLERSLPWETELILHNDEIRLVP